MGWLGVIHLFIPLLPPIGAPPIIQTHILTGLRPHRLHRSRAATWFKSSGTGNILRSSVGRATSIWPQPVHRISSRQSRSIKVAVVGGSVSRRGAMAGESLAALVRVSLLPN